MDEIKISVVMPVYNAEEFLEESLGDLLAQTFSEYEVICVNDGSTDRSTEILKLFQAKDSRVKVLEQENAGAGAARNRGMDIAKGKYFLFLDADDRFEKTMLEQLWNKAEKVKSDIMIFAADCFLYGTERKRAANWLLDKKYLVDEYVENDVIKLDKKNQILYKISTSTVWNKLFRREFVISNKLYFQEIYVVDSMYFVMLAMAYANRIAVYDKVLIHYRENVPTGQIMNHDKSPTGVYEALAAVRQRLLNEKMYAEIEAAFVKYAVKACLDRLACFASAKAEEALYNILHNEGFRALGLELTHNILNISPAQWDICRKIEALEYTEYLFQQKKALHNMINSNGFVYQLSHEGLTGKKKIAIYGAGNVGKSYFIHLLGKKEYQLVGWFDKNYETYGYPVENPSLLCERMIDVILIAVQMDTVAEEIKRDLFNLGIEKEKLVWIEPRIL